QKKLLDSGGKVVQETRLWNSSKGKTFSMRSKEEASDYRYFPDPDLKPIYVSGEMLEIEKAGLPELPGAVKERFMNQGLTEYQADILTDEKVLADYFDKIIAGLTPDGQEEAANIVISNLLAEANQSNLPLDAFLNSVKPAYICELVKFRQEGKINKQVLKTIFPKMIKEQKAPRELIKDVNIVSDESEIVKLVEDAIRANASSWEDYRAGKEKASGRIVSHVMKESRGAADPATVMRILKRMAGE
ncbi:MAG: Asp-tRNA(Asn)/Glu-tRNA(Gln) amidotransferase GatCAB subunit B, partial [Elusimicrobia bacterium CG_4_10_14_3_um_filter_49_12_50_7]